MNLWRQYFSRLEKILETVEKNEDSKIEKAAQLIFEALQRNRLVYVFGTGHSHMLAEEMFYRAGGLVSIYPILETSLMLHESAARSSKLERLPGLARVILERYSLKEGDVMIVASNSGVNAVPVEAAIRGRELGASVICITSIAHSSSVEPRNPAGKRLFEVADVVIDNHIPIGDGLLDISNTKVAPASTAVGATILNSIVGQVAWLYSKNGELPPVFSSANTQNGDLENSELIQIYRKIIPIL
ncbi:MAG TPA: SIS domain-containing protein [Mesotoga sp.]|nr:SIS domain-containing protein [Mesotoga sp.]